MAIRTQIKPIFIFCYFEVEDNWRHISTGEHIMIVLSFIGIGLL